MALRTLLPLVCLLGQLAWAEPRQIDEHHWAGVARIVAVGDLHGDFDNYMATLRAAGLVDRRGRWAASRTHLVQTGDIPDRGPDTRRIIEHMAGLAQQARRRGGRVHNLMGNHEAMNVYGDLRYVTPGEFEAFADRRSQALRERYVDALVDDIRARDPERFAALPEDFRQRWFKDHPPGWLEHRMAWNPGWNPDGEMFRWVMDTKVSIQINNLIFLHAGISGFYCADSLNSMTERAHDALSRSDPDDLGILTDEYGPLWYRGLAGVAPEAPTETIEAILERHDAHYIVIGHTPTGGFIRPRHGGRVIQIDTGIGVHYGGHIAYLEIEEGTLYAGYAAGKVRLPQRSEGLQAYLGQVQKLIPDNAAVGRLMQQLAAAPAPDQETDSDMEHPRGEVSDIPICGTRM